MLNKLRDRQKGFTLIELLIVVAIIGIIAAILIPNFLDALQKGRSKRTMGDVRQIGLAVTAYLTDNGGAAAAGQVVITEGDWTGTTDTFTALEDLLVPDYSSALAERDGWGNVLTYHFHMFQPPRQGWGMIISPGRDGAQETSWTSGTFHPTDYDQDIVWADGGFVRASQSAAVT
jgi:prepilin-type N-terminal cleavage/methylation domain-containing protein